MSSEEHKNFEFTLPDVSETSGSFIDDPEVPGEGEVVSDTVSEPSDEVVRDDKERSRGLTSSGGDQFDPSIHQFPPKETKTGKWRRKRKTDAESETIQSNVAYEVEAQKLAALYAHLHTLPFGEHGRLKSKTDIIPLSDALAAYMAENGLKEVPPTLAVLLTAGAYSSSVATRPENMEKTKKVGSFFVRGFRKLFRLKPKVKKERIEPTLSEGPVMNVNPTNGGPF